MERGLSALEPRDDRRPYAKERASKLAAKVPTLAVRVVPEVAGALVTIDGEAVPLDEARTARPVDPGAHTIVVKADGQSGRAEITLALGEQREATVTLSPEGGPSRPDKPSGGMRTAAFIAGGVGVLGVAAFGVTAGVIQGHRGTVASACDARKQCTAEGLDAAAAGKSLLPINTAALIVGALGLTAGVTLFVLSPSNPDTSAAAALRVDGAPDRLSASVVGVF